MAVSMVNLTSSRKIGAKKQVEAFRGAGSVRNLLFLLVRPERFELPAVGFEVRKISFPLFSTTSHNRLISVLFIKWFFYCFMSIFIIY